MSGAVGSPNAHGEKRIRSARDRRRLWAGLAALGLLLFGLWTTYYCSPALLTVDSGECRPAAIIVLGGDSYGRPIRAAELFRSNAAPVVIASGNGDIDEMVRALKQNGIPDSAILREEKSRSTRQNAEFTVALLRERHASNAIVVTSWYHSRRALYTFRTAAPEIQFYSRPSYWGLERSMWSQHGIGAHIRWEYLKLVWYWGWYGVRPF